MPYSPSRGLLYSAPPNDEPDRPADDEATTEEPTADAESTPNAAPTPADD